MVELKGECMVLRALEREHCRALWEQTEVNVDMPTEFFQPGLAKENADKWFDEIQAQQGETGIDLGIFDLEGNVIGHVQLHHIDWQTRSAEVGLGLARASDRGKGYGTEATRVICV